MFFYLRCFAALANFALGIHNGPTEAGICQLAFGLYILGDILKEVTIKPTGAS
jgi:hypothetical protein